MSRRWFVLVLVVSLAAVLAVGCEASGPAVKATIPVTPVETPGDPVVAAPESQPTITATQAATAAPASPAATSNPVPSPVTLGMLAPLTGADAAQGIQARQGSELALTRINREGGILGRPLGLRVIEAQGGPGEMAQRYQALVNDGAAMIFLVSSNLTAVQLSPHIRNAQAPTFTTATAPILSAQGIPWIIQLLPNEDRQARAAMRFARQQLSADQIVVMYSNDDYGLGAFRAAQLELRDIFRREITQAIPLNLDGGNVPAALQQQRAANPTATLVLARPALVAQVMRQARVGGAVGSFITIAESTSLSALDLFSASDANGWYAVSPIPPTLRTDKDLARDMVQAYRAAYRADPDIIAALHYDAMGIAVEGIRRARSVDPEPLLRAVDSIAAYDGVLGRYVYAGGHIGLQDLYVLRFEGRNLVVHSGP